MHIYKFEEMLINDTEKEKELQEYRILIWDFSTAWSCTTTKHNYNVDLEVIRLQWYLGPDFLDALLNRLRFGVCLIK